MVKLSEEVAKALMAAKGEAVVVDVPGIDDDFVIVQRSMFVAAMAALEHQRNVELIREGSKLGQDGLIGIGDVRRDGAYVSISHIFVVVYPASTCLLANLFIIIIFTIKLMCIF